jgi:hypothetical protein
VLISALVLAAFGTMYDQISALKYLTACCAIVGLLLVIWAAVLVIVENSRLQLILDSDLSDIEESVRVEHGGGESQNSARGVREP